MSKLSDNFPNQELAANPMRWLHSFGWLQTKLPETIFLVETWFFRIRFLLLSTSLDYNSDSGNFHDQFSMALYPIHIVGKYSHPTNELSRHILGILIHRQKKFQIR